MGAGTPNNVIARAREYIVPTLQERLDGYEEPAETVAEVLGIEIEKILEEVNLLYPGSNVETTCFTYDATLKQHSTLNCDSSEGDPTSLQWTIPLGQKYEIEVPLNFAVSSGAFPLELKLTGDDVPTLTIAWQFTLGVGFDETEGFFLSTFEGDALPDGRSSEFEVTALLDIPNQELNATLFVLNAYMADLDIKVGAGVFIDVVKPNNVAGPTYGRITRGDLRSLNQISDLFEITAVAGATIQSPMETSVVLPASLSEIEHFIPKLRGDIAVQVRKEIELFGRRRKLLSDADRRRLGIIHINSDHPASGILRWLAGEEVACDVLQNPTSDELELYNSDFGRCWTPCPLEGDGVLCAVMTDVQLDIQSVSDAILPIVEDFANGEDGYLDKVVQPFQPLGESLPGYSDLTGDDLSLLDIALIYDPECGAETVKKVLQLYEDLIDFVDTLDQGYIEIATSCDIAAGFSCTGGVFDDERRLEAEDDRLIDPSSGPRSLAESCDEECVLTTSCTKVLRFKCKASKVEGLVFPFIQEPASVINLLQGGDIVSTNRRPIKSLLGTLQLTFCDFTPPVQRLVEFTPPEITFSFSHELRFTLYTPPTVTLEIYFEFTARFKYGIVLDTKGIRESIEQSAPLKALNSFALMDTFDGVDEPLVSMTARVGFEVAVSAAIVKVSVGGGIVITATIDFYDPYPETSGGLVRPFEMLSFSLNIIEWFEFTVSLTLELSVAISVGIYLGFFEITLYERRETFSTELIPTLYFAPGKPEDIVVCNSDRNTMTLLDPGTTLLECTSLGGSLGDETIECIRENSIQSCYNVKRIDTETNTADTVNIVLRGIQSPTNIKEFGDVTLELDYFDLGSDGIANDAITIEQKSSTMGIFATEFTAGGSAVLRLPEPEQDFLKTTITGGCDTEWELVGHTSLIVKASEVESNCNIVADGGATIANLLIDLTPGELSPCSDGNVVILEATDVNTTLVTVTVKRQAEITTTVQVGNIFRNIEVIMTDCSDKVEILNTVDVEGSISVSGKGGDDIVRVGISSEGGLDKIYKRIIVAGGGGEEDALIVLDSGSDRAKETGVMRSTTISGLLNGFTLNETKTVQDIVYTGMEVLEVYLSPKSNTFNVESTAPGSWTKIFGGVEADIFYIHETQGDLRLEAGGGNDNITITGLGDGATAVIYGDAGDDYLEVDGRGASNVDLANSLDNSTVKWSGGADNDKLLAYLTSTGDSVIDIFDDTLGSNVLQVECGDYNCTVLSRENFLANVHDPGNVSSSVERINLNNTAFISQTILRLNGGNNEVHFDDTMSAFDVFGGPNQDGEGYDARVRSSAFVLSFCCC
jgi:hypothetical protein